MRQCFSIIILVMFAVIISGCSPRGATGDNGSGGISNDDKFVPNLIDTVETEEELRRETVITNDDAGSMYHSLTEASDDSNGQDKIFTLSGLVVQGGQNTNYTLGDDAFGWTRDSETTASLIRVTLPAVSLTFDGNDGHIAAVTAYFADKTYHIAPNNNGSATHFSADITSGATSDATNAMLTVDRGNDFFGFSSNYMVHIGWNLDRVEGDPNPLTDSGDNLDRSYDINGSMLAGIETQNAHIPTRDTLSFNGKGKGYYTHIGNEENYTTIFDIVARINFTAESLTINSSNTMQCAVQNVVSSCNNSVNFLNFTTPEALTYTGNNISGGVVLASDLSVSGIVDARFYGVAAREFGGAFAIRGTEDGYYYGAFGGEREGIINPTVFGGIGNDVIASPQSEAIANDGDGLLYTSLAAAVADTSYMGDARVFTLKGVASYRNENISYARAPNRTWDKADIDKRIDMATITGSAVSLTLNDDGKIAAVMLHLNNETYISDQFIAVSGEIVSTVINDGAPDNANFARVVVDRSARFFNFSTASNYMTYVSWRLTRNADRGQTSTLLNDSNYRFDGNMIAGMETIGSDITTSGESIFRGRGRGTYGSEFESYATIFDVVANVDFASYVINLNIENNCEASYCIATPLSHLDFSTRLNYNASTNDSSGSANTGQLSGEVNARFYGPGVDEFGGTFILSGNNVNDYYYGAFGSKRGVIAERPAFVTNIYSDILGYNRELDITSQIQKNRHTSLTEASSVTAGENILAMNALAVYKNDTTTYSEHSTGQTWTTSRTSQELYTANILNPAAAVEFNENGDISGVTAYLAYETYEANNFNPSSAKELSVAINSGAGDASVAILNINRSDDFFGFNPNYMAYISWNLIKTVDDLDDRSNATRAIIYDIDGSMLAGLETDESNIPTIKTVSFDGKGRGLYGNLTENHTTIFDVKATVDFTAFMIDISVEDTMQCSDSNDISSCNTAMGALDFNVSALNFTNSDNVVNNIKGNVSAGSLSGTLDARFYGDVAWEFGGTFALTDSNSYYFGAFGSERDGIATPFMFDSVISAESVSADEAQVIDNAIILNNNAANDNIVTMRGLSVYQNDVTDYIRAPNRAWAKADIERNLNLARLSGSAASFGLAEDDSGISLITAYLNGNIYTANIANPTSSMSASATITEGAASDANTAILNIETGIDFFGFLSNAMIYVSWNLAREISDFDDSDSLTDRTYNIKGSMIAGIETLDTSISATGTANFDGKGRGTYKNISDDTGYETIFDVVTVVDFTNSNVTISSSGTCKASDCAMKVSALDFTSNALSYTDNNISGAVNTDGIGAGSLSGTLDARFYGYDEAVALGGTFALSDSVSYYYGAFGTQKDYTIFTKVATTRSDTPTTFNSNNLTSFSKNSMDDISGNIFKIKTAVEVTKNNTDKTIYTNKITDAVVDFDYTSDYVFNDYSFFLAELKLYFADKKYERTDLYDGYKNTAYIDGDGAVDNPSNFDMSLRNKFGFTSNYMALVEWQVAGDNGGTSGYGITGFETAGNKIPTIRSVGFTGKGQGQYYDLTNIANVIYFDMTANVDFSKRTVDLVTTKSCITEKYSHCSTADTRDDLNFTGALSYDAGVNTITGTVETAGDASNLKLTGNAEAYFFSTGVAELGGTFHMQNSLASYVGFFGGEREFYLFVNNITTAHADKPTSFNKHGLASFNDVNRNGKTDNAFKMIAVQVVRDKDNGTFTSNKFIDAVAEFDYNPDGTYSDMGMAFYLGDTKHDITDATVRINTNSYGDVTSTEVNGDGSDSYIFNSIFGNIVANIIFGFGEDGDNITSAGFGLTGFEMADDAIPNAGLIRFSGSGSGQIYGSDVNTLWSFALNADVDFSKRTVDITGQHPDYQGYAFSELDFAGTLQYKAGENMLIGGIESVGGDEFGKLTGDVEARFYGSGLNSLGGVFVMQNDIIGYAGYFVAGRVGYHSPPAMNIATTHAERPETFNQYGLTSFNDANRNSKTGNALKINSLVQASIDSDNRIITVDRITDAVVQFDYKGNGDFVDTGAILYMADKKYQITAGDGADGVFGSTMISGGDDSSDDITGFVLFKWTAGELFSFDSDYMALVQWPSFDDEHDNTHFGYGVTGFTTAGNTIPTTGNLTFIGTGTGYYLGATTYLSYASFSFKADVDFSKRVVNLSSTGFNSSDDRLEDAQLTAVLNYKIGENALTGKIETVGASDKYSALTGTVEANFYGPNTKNLGGTFNMSSSDSSYFGYFGGENKIATPPTSGNMLVTITDVAAPTTFTTLDSFNDDDRKGTSDNALQLNAAGVTRDGTTNALTTNKINGAVIEFDYQGNGHFADDGLTLYIAGKKHEITGATATENAIIFDAVSDYDEDDAFLAPPQILTLNRDRFGFTSNYMANIYWRSYVDLNLEESSFVALIQSSAIAGFETVGSAISTTSSNVSFSGKGRGHYHLSDDFGDIYFDVTADVNFSARTVSLFSTNACISSISYDCLELNNQLPRLNFTGNLSYASGTNAISGNVETAGDADNAKLTGTAEAKFYGPAAEELGGTFRMSNADIAYVGWFGATNNLVATPPTPPTSSPMLVTTDAEAPTTFTTLNSFNDNARKGTSDNALQANAVKITIDGTTKAITTNKISNSVVELDYQTNGDFSADGLTLYIAGKKHEINGATVSEHQIYYEISLTDDDIAAGIQPPHPQLISLDRSAFGFTSDYMARIFWLSYVDWSPSEDSYSSASIGYAITGFETSNIPNADTVATTFNGKGEGVYWQGNGDVVVEVLTFFDVTANVNFATRKVGLSSTNTCSSSNASLCAEGSDKLRPHFNWTGELSYAVDESDIAINAISGNVETAGDADNAKLTGTADARFYGPAAEELGGTFRMSNDDASYAGWFGAKK